MRINENKGYQYLYLKWAHPSKVSYPWLTTTYDRQNPITKAQHVFRKKAQRIQYSLTCLQIPVVNKCDFSTYTFYFCKLPYMTNSTVNILSWIVIADLAVSVGAREKF